MQTNLNAHWRAEAQRAHLIEEQRYCWARAIEEDEYDDDARAALAALGNGPMRAPRSAAVEVVFLSPPPPHQQTRLSPSRKAAAQSTNGAVFIVGFLVGAAVVLSILAVAHAFGWM